MDPKYLNTVKAILVDSSGAPITLPSAGQAAVVYPDAAFAKDVTSGQAGPFSATGAGTLFTIDTTGYDSLAVALTNPGTGCTISFYGSNDNTNFLPLNGDRLDANTGSAASTSSTGLWVFGCEFRYIRWSISTYGSGSVVCSALLRSSSVPPRSLSINQSSVLVGKTTSGGLSQASFRSPTAASANGTVIKASAGQLYGYNVTNTTASWRYLHFYNQTSAPGVGNGDVRVVAIPPNSSISYSTDIGIAFSSGIAVAITTSPTNNIASGDYSNIAAGDVVGAFDYA